MSSHVRSPVEQQRAQVEKSTLTHKVKKKKRKSVSLSEKSWPCTHRMSRGSWSALLTHPPLTFKLSQKCDFLISGDKPLLSTRDVSIDAYWNTTSPQQWHFCECLKMFTLGIKTSRNSINKMWLSQIIIRRAFLTRQIL